MRVALVMPPVWDACNPYLSIPILAQALRSAGHHVLVKDANVEAQNFVFSRNFLETCKRRLEKNICTLESRDLLPILRVNQYANLITGMPRLEYALDNIEEAKSIFRNPCKFFNPSKYFWAENVFRLACQCITDAFLDSDDLLVEKFHGFLSSFLKKDRGGESATVRDIVNCSLSYNGILRAFISSGGIVEDLVSYEPDVVGFTIFTRGQLLYSLVMASVLKRKRPRKVKTVAGGGIPTRLVASGTRTLDLLMEIEAFDYYVVGRGETAVVELMDFVQGKMPISQVSNLVYKKNGEVNVNRIGKTNDQIVCPDFDGLPFDLYFSPSLVLPYLLTCGCYWNRCKFCEHRFLYDSDYSEPAIDTAVDHLKHLSEKYDTKNFYFCDESPKPNFLFDFSYELLRQRAGIHWIVNSRFDHDLIRDDFDVLSRAGCSKLRFGYEWGNQYLLDLYDKGTALADVKSILSLCKKNEMTVYLYAIIGAPKETMQIHQESLDFIMAHRDIIDSPGFQFDFGSFAVLPTAPLAKCLEDFGVTVIDRRGGYDTIYAWAEKHIGANHEEEAENKVVTAFSLKGYPLRYLSHSLLYQLHFHGRPVSEEADINKYAEGKNRCYRPTEHIDIRCKFGQVFDRKLLAEQLKRDSLTPNPITKRFEVKHATFIQDASSQFCPVIAISPAN